MAEDAQPEETKFSLLEFWKLRRTGMPFLALIARLCNGVEFTSCQAERHFSALAFLIGHLRSSTAPAKVERLMFLHLNRLFIPEIKALHDAFEAKKAAADRCKERVGQVEAAAAGSTIDLRLLFCCVLFTVYDHTKYTMGVLKLPFCRRYCCADMYCVDMCPYENSSFWDGGGWLRVVNS
ncbi:unnamed protein product [Pylaiella littoralis]